MDTTPVGQKKRFPSGKLIGILGAIALVMVVAASLFAKTTLIFLSPPIAALSWFGVLAVAISIFRLITNRFPPGHSRTFKWVAGSISSLILAVILFTGVGLIAGLSENNELQRQKKVESSSFTLLSPSNNSIISGPVTFSLPSSRQIQVENIGSSLQTEIVDHATIVIRGPVNKEVRPYRQGKKLLFTADLPSGTYAVFARQEPANDQAGYDYNSYQFDHPATPKVSFQVNSPAFTPDITKPQIQIISPTANTKPAPTVASATITAIASDNRQAVSAEIYVNNYLWCPSLPVINGTATCELHLKYNAPVQSIKAKVYDSQGNEGVAEVTL